uniref:Uncharacterized protein n=1 Tax=Anguilla anguilla TaxID=7936 RepID=A0A0E9V0G8_ANGAN
MLTGDKDNSGSTGIKEKRIKCDYKNIRGDNKSRKGSEKDFSTHCIYNPWVATLQG